MNKKFKLYSIIAVASFMVITWAIIYFSHMVGQKTNYFWQVAMGLAGLYYAVLGIMTAGKWGWLKSGVGRGIFFISLALLMWSIGQIGWSYFLFVDPSVQSPPSHVLDIIDISAIPLWFIGIIMLSKATGARYGWRRRKGQIAATLISLAMVGISYYFLVVVARGGTAYFAQPFWKAFFDLGYSIGDAITATIAIVIFVLSWRMLGGRFRVPILVILLAFLLLYIADFSFSFMDGRGKYYNGDVVDLFYMLMITTFALGVSMLDPDHVRRRPAAVVTPDETAPALPPAAPTAPPAVPPATPGGSL